MPIGIDGNGFSSLILRVVGKAMFEKLVGSQNTSNIDKKFEQAIDVTAKRIQNKHPEAFGGSLDIIFSEPDIREELTKLLFRSTNVNIQKLKDKFDLSTLPDYIIEDFILELKNELSTYHEFERIFSDTELHQKFYEITEKIENSLMDKPQFNYNDFYEEYTKSVLRSFTKINYFGLGLSPSVRRGEKSLDDIYVIPRFANTNKSLNKVTIDSVTDEKNIINIDNDFEEKSLNTLDLLNDISKHVVVLGNPGTGKSILGKFLTCSIIRKDSKVIPHYLSKAIPFRLELRKYLPYKRKYSASLLEYITHVIKTDNLISYFNVDNLVNILENEISFIIFDGLDEIFDIQDKIEVKKDIENFLYKYTNCKGIVTSRYIGYEEAKLDNNIFKEFAILNFNESQIKEYVYKWYDCEVENIDDSVKKEIEYFLTNINELDNELIENPLLLSLIVILYRNNGSLPNSKLEIYRSCTNTLVDKWDETKNLDIDIKVNTKKNSIFSFLAMWQYEHLSNTSQDSNEITYPLVLSEVTHIIQNQLNLTNDHSEATKWAEEFLEYAKNRSLYFDNDFTHKTFMEYFTAYNIFQNTDVKLKPDERNNIISRYINNSFWFIVLELLVNLIDENQADNEIIDGLIMEHTKKDDDAYIFFLEILTTLKNVSDNVVRYIIKYAIKLAIERCNMSSKENNYSYEIASKINSLLISKKFRNIIQEEYDDLYKKFKLKDNLLVKYYIFAHDINVLIRKEERLNINNNNDLSRLKFKDRYLYRVTVETNELDIIDYVNNFGLDDVFEPYEFQYRENVFFSPMIESFYYKYILKFEKDKFESELDFLIKKGINKEKLANTFRNIKDRNKQVQGLENILNKYIKI